MYPISELLQDAFHRNIMLNNRVITYKDYDQHLKVYTNALNDRGEKVKYKQPENLTAGDTVIASEDEVFEMIEDQYDFDVVNNDDDLKIYAIKGVKK